MEKKEKQENQVNIELSDEMATGTYSNFAIITHSPTEFVFDFIQFVPGVPKAKVKSRIITTPQHAKKFLNALADNIAKYEAQNGPIQDLEQPKGFPMNFGGTQGEA
ncbi:MAG: DUF3467 domain-containing protein [Bacteroidetes bacterium]|nr:MAG: DUF3467 domain-containing protein [Bacteroidota bacterium]